MGVRTLPSPAIGHRLMEVSAMASSAEEHGHPTTLSARSPADAPLLDQIRGGDRRAFTTLVRQHDSRLRGLAYRVLSGDRDRMDDALQDAYVRAFSALDEFRRDGDFGTWLYRIAYNACIDELRRARRRPEPIDTNAARWDRPSAASPPDTLAVTADTTARALASLSEAQRVTVVLVDGEGFDQESAARILGVAPGTVASRLSRARTLMRRSLALPDPLTDARAPHTDDDGALR
jgi:RNA polymerase sigma-70 factor (ECF subfamily)